MIIHARYLLIIIAVFSLSTPLFSQSQKPSSEISATDSIRATNLYTQALQEISQQNFQSAENLLGEALRIEPTHQEARFALIRLYFSRQEYDKAERIAKAGTELTPEQPLIWEALSDVYKATKNYEAILEVFDHLIQIDPQQTKNYLDKAYTYTLMEDYKQALEVYHETESKFGLDENIVSGRINVYLKQGKDRQALKEATHYLDKNKNEDSRAYLMLANLYLDLKNPKEALKTLEEAEQKFQDEPYLYLTKADVYKSLGNEDRLVKELKKAFSFESLHLDDKIKILFNIYQDFEQERAIEISNTLSQILIDAHPNEPNAYAVYGDILLQQNKNEEALEKFRKALELNPRMDIIWENILQIQVAEAKYAEAQSEGKRALRYAPQNPVLLLFTGYAFSFDKKYAEARPYLESALNNADPENKVLQLQIYSGLGDLYNGLELYDVSNAAYEEALSIDSNNTYVLNNYAYYLSLRKENLDKANKYSKRSNELQPGNASFQDTYAWVLYQQGNYSEALVWIEKAVKSSLEPSSTLLEHYGDILYKLGKEREALNHWKDALKISLANGENPKPLENKIKNKDYGQ